MSNDHRHGSDVMHELHEPARALRAAIPDVYEGFRAMSASAFAENAVDARTKELMHTRDRRRAAVRRMHRLPCARSREADATPSRPRRSGWRSS